MIALISFDSDMCMKLEEAKKLKLEYEEIDRVGYGTNYSKKFADKISKMGSSSYYIDDVEKEEIEGDIKYYTKNEERKEISSYSVYKKPSDSEGFVYINSDNHLVDIEDFALKCSYPFRIKKCVKSEEANIQNIQSLLNKIEEKTQNLDKTIEVMKSQSFNQKANVHVGGGLMVTYNDLLLKEDCCTDELQRKLNDGWRIIAVCVQEDQRRPDYILGRYNTELEVTAKAQADR